jgi:signal transduction histidine kinase
MARGRGRWDSTTGLTPRIVVASLVLALLVGGVFAILLVAIEDQRDSARLASHSRAELADADRLEKLVIDLETGQRGFVITGEERFLEPWNSARAAFPRQARMLVRFVDSPEQQRQALRIARAGTSYIRDYSVPLVKAARRDEAAARSIVVTAEGKRRVDALRDEFDRFATVERALLTSRQESADADARRAIVAGAVGLAGSVVLILVFAGYLTRTIGRPVRRAAAMAGRLAAGDLAVRMPETGPGEVGALERAFNAMARSLEASRDALRASRARIVAAADETRRRIERDLHDGAQQRLVHAVITLKLARRALQDGDPKAGDLVGEGLEHTERATSELRELAHGILPSVLTRGGLRAGVESLASRISLPVDQEVTGERLPAGIEATAYFVVSEALTNAVKHSGAGRAKVRAGIEDGALRVEVRDNGVGGARFEEGTGLIGLDDRVAALDGRLEVESPPGRGTVIVATLPVQEP